MKKLFIVAVILVFISGCALVDSNTQARAHRARLIAEKAVDLFDENKPAENKKFLEANARAWKAFDEALNGMQ